MDDLIHRKDNKTLGNTSGLNQQRRTTARAFSRFIVSIPAQAVLLLIRIYQLILSPLKQFVFGPSCGCRFQPTCSHYAYDAFAHFGLWKGFWLTLRRLLRCHPWHSGGLDPLPGTNYSK